MTHRPFALAAILVPFSAPTVSAAPVFFVNPEGADRHEVRTFLAPQPFEFIDVSKPADKQPAPGSDPLAGSAFSWSYIVGENNVPVGGVIAGPWRAIDVSPSAGFAITGGTHPRVFQFGDIIDTSFLGEVDLEVLSALLPGDSTGYLGLRFALWNEAGTDFTTHFGWMQVDWLGQGLTGGVDLDLLAWGFETEPDTPIAAGAGLPAPGAAGLFALAGAFAAQRRRRR